MGALLCLSTPQAPPAEHIQIIRSYLFSETSQEGLLVFLWQRDGTIQTGGCFAKTGYYGGLVEPGVLLQSAMPMPQKKNARPIGPRVLSN